jgi:hypothetical protein
VLVIRDKQMEALEEALIDSFIKKQTTIFQNRWPEEFNQIGEEHVNQSITKAIRKCEVCKISQQELITRFLDLMFSSGQDFETFMQNDWISEILENNAIDAFDKIEGLEEEKLKTDSISLIRQEFQEILEEMGKKGISDAISVLWRTCRLYGIDVVKLGIRFVRMKLTLGLASQPIENYSWGQAILANERLSSETKIEQLEAALHNHLND